MAAAPIKENKFSFNLRVMGYEFGPQSSTQSHLSSHSTFNQLSLIQQHINHFSFLQQQAKGKAVEMKQIERFAEWNGAALEEPPAHNPQIQ